MLQPINKNTIKAQLRKGETFKGWIAPSKVSAFHVNGGWHIGMEIEVSSLEQLEEVSSNFAIYNCNSELGQTVRYWK